MSPRVTGTVESFDSSKGFGYIQTDDADKIFVHYSSITDNEIQNLREGEEVEFSIKQSPRGPEAIEVIHL